MLFELASLIYSSFLALEFVLNFCRHLCINLSFPDHVVLLYLTLAAISISCWWNSARGIVQCCCVIDTGVAQNSTPTSQRSRPKAGVSQSQRAYQLN